MRENTESLWEIQGFWFGIWRFCFLGAYHPIFVEISRWRTKQRWKSKECNFQTPNKL